MDPIQNPVGAGPQWHGHEWVAVAAPHQERPPRTLGLFLVGAVVLAVVAVWVRPGADSGWARSVVGPATVPTDTNVMLGPDTTVAQQTDSLVPPAPAPTATEASTEPSPTAPTSPTSPTTAPTAHTAPDAEAALADENFFVTLLPELRDMPAPTWVAQGSRLTYYASAASVANSYHRYVEDEEGNWVDPTTGDHYRREDIETAAGHGYTQVDVVALNDSIAALSIRAFGLSDLALDSSVTTLTWGGAVGIPGAGSDYWLHPDVLAQIDEVVTDDLKIVRMPYSIGDTQFSSIWLQSISDLGNYTWVYDLDSGVLLHTAGATQGPPITGPVAQGEGRDGSTFLTQSTLVNMRQPALPWATAAAPAWVDSVNHVEYDSTVTVDVTGSPIYLAAGLTVDRRTSGTDWARYLFSRTLYSDVAPSVTEYMERVDGAAQVGGLWISPDALDQLSAGQELDFDPVTQASVSVSAVDATDSGFTVTIHESGAGEVSDLVYDGQSGLLVASSYANLLLGTRIDYQLTSWS